MPLPQITATRLTDPPAAGDGDVRDVLVVGAGLGTSVSALWAEAAPLLSDRFDVIGWDLPGHGDSPAHPGPLSVADLAGAVAARIRSLRADGTIAEGARVLSAGVSLNGQVTLQLGLDHGDVVDGLAVICSAAQIGDPVAWRERAELVRADGTVTQVAGSAERWFAPGFAARHPARAQALLASLDAADDASYARLCEALAAFDVRDRLGEISVPALALTGAHDAVAPPDRGDETARGVQHGTAAVVDDAAHQAPLEDPAETARLLAGFASALPR